MNNINILIVLGVCLGYVYYNNHKLYTDEIKINLYEINNILTSKELNDQFNRDHKRFRTKINIPLIVYTKPQLKVFFTQTIYNYLYHFYLAPSLINKNFYIFDKTNMNNEEHITFENNKFSEKRYFQVSVPDNELIIANIFTKLTYNYGRNYIKLKIRYRSNERLFDLIKYKNAFII